jgi:Protein of unknown function (DUF3489)
MRIYIINGNEITVTSKRPAEKKGVLAIGSAEELVAARLPAKRLMAIWNGLPGVRRVTKVADREAMLERLWAGLEALPAPKGRKPETAADAPRVSKQAQVIEMLRRAGGATLEEIVAATGWQPHTARGVIAGALKKKLELEVTAAKEERGRVYRIAA